MCVLYKSSHDDYRSRLSRRSRAVDVKEMYQKEGLKKCRAQCYFSHKTNCFVDVVVVVVVVAYGSVNRFASAIHRSGQITSNARISANGLTGLDNSQFIKFGY